MVVEIPFFRSWEPVRGNERIVRPRTVSGGNAIPVVVLGQEGQAGVQEERGGRGGGRESFPNHGYNNGGYRGGQRDGHRGGYGDGFGRYNHRGGDVGVRDRRDRRGNGQINQGYNLIF
jgi:hypothetical protein